MNAKDVTVCFKDIDLSPCHYDVTEKPVPKLPRKYEGVFELLHD